MQMHAYDRQLAFYANAYDRQLAFTFLSWFYYQQGIVNAFLFVLK